MKNFKIIHIIVLTSTIFTLGFGGWRAIFPQPLKWATMVADSINQRIIIFGGGNGSVWFKDTWEILALDSNSYGLACLQVAGNPPTGRGGHAFVCNQQGQEAIVFGGDTLTSDRTNDVWALDLTPGIESWHQLYPTGTPPAERSEVSGIYYPPRNSVIIFGGSGNSAHFNDVWEVDLGTPSWRQIFPTGQLPPARYGNCCFFDEGNNRMLVFGGRNYDTGEFFNDLWELSLASGSEQWTQLSPTGVLPANRSGFASGYNRLTRKLYIFGGYGYGAVYFNNIFELDLDSLNWRQLLPQGELPPPMRHPAGVCYDINNDFLIFGGQDNFGSHTNIAYLLDLDSITGAALEWTPTFRAEPLLMINSPAAGPVRVRFVLPAAEASEEIEVSIIDVSGRIVKSLFSGRAPSSSGWLEWKGCDEHGRRCNAGVFFCRLQAEDVSISKKFCLIE